MPLTTTSVLLVEDNPADARFVREMLPIRFYRFQHATCLHDAHEVIRDSGISVVLLDLSLPDGNGLETCLSMIDWAPNTPIIILTGLDDENLAVDAVRLGAQDYILKKDISEGTLSRSIRYAVERKRAEEEIRQSAVQAQAAEAQAREVTASLKLALKASNTAVWAWDINSDRLTADDHMDSILGLEPGKLGSTLQSATDLIHPEDRAESVQKIRHAVETRSDYYDEFRIIKSDGTIRFIANRGKVLEDSSSRSLRMMGVSTDITKQKEEQENAKRLLVLEHYEEFVATLSHDLKTPLVGANRLLDMFVEGDLGSLETEQRRLLGLIHKSNSEMLGMIQSLLDVYRIESGVLELVIVEIDVQSLVLGCIDSSVAGRPNLVADVLTDFDSGPHTIWADSTAIRRVLMNLLSNALKFTQVGATITVSGRNHGETYVLEVADTGAGIAQPDLEQLFQRFAQAKLGKKYTLGTGLGLYLCRQLIEAHGGTITCKSVEGTGATFTIVLPLKKPYGT